MPLLKVGSLFLLAFFLVGCANSEFYEFLGEGEHWVAKYTIEVTEGAFVFAQEKESKNQNIENLKLDYKGDREELRAIRDFSYELKFSSNLKINNSTSLSDDRPMNESFLRWGVKTSGELDFDLNNDIKVTVVWDDNKETFEIKNKRKE